MTRAAKILKRALQRAVNNKTLNVGEVVATWQDAPPPADPNVESTYVTPTPRTQTLRALIHFVQPATTVPMTFAEIEVGDVILDLMDDVTLPDGATFTITGSNGIFVQKNVGGALAQYWDAVIGGERMFRTVVLTGAR